MFFSIESFDNPFCKALSTATFNLGFPSGFGPPVLAATLISRASFCQILD
jgi:hypothetical protein